MVDLKPVMAFIASLAFVHSLLFAVSEFDLVEIALSLAVLQLRHMRLLFSGEVSILAEDGFHGLDGGQDFVDNSFAA